MLGHSLEEWHVKTRSEIGLATDRPVIATGHQTLLWHPGILSKYLVVDAFSRSSDRALATANLIVDQHAEGFGHFEAPVRHRDGSLGLRRIALTEPHKGVPMGLHAPFIPDTPPMHLPFALDSVRAGVERIVAAVGAHTHSANAALQMTQALADLMQPWIAPMPTVTATDLLESSLGRAILGEMAADPHRCAAVYNEAVSRLPEAGVAPLLVRDVYVEMPMWRIRADGRRMHAFDNDIEPWLEGGADAPVLLPRALLMTALIRLGMCDLFVHGTGGANYDRAMESWIRSWLGVEAGAKVVATATLRLPLGSPEETIDLDEARSAARHAWHDPERRGGRSPSASKGRLLERIAAAPRSTDERREAFFEMHRALAALRQANPATLESAQARAAKAGRQAADERIAQRRDWPFPLYPEEQIDRLAEEVRTAVGEACRRG
jgi:hypothetical protein